MAEIESKKTYFWIKWNNYILSLCEKTESIKSRIPEIIVFVVWSVFHFVTSAFHERWFDEGAAWQIAKNATFSELLFKVPHNEGHPFLWHLILRPFARLGAPYSLSLSVIGFLLMGGMIFLVLFCTHLPRIVKWLFPFGFFVLFQYGVIVRPYALMAFVFVILALLHKKRNEKPVRYAICLTFLCLSSAYGIIISFGVCLAWFCEIVKEANRCLRRVLKDKRTQTMLLLGVIALLLVISVLPQGENYATHATSSAMSPQKVLIGLLYALFLLPADALLTNFFSEYGRLLMYEFSLFELITGVIIGTIILASAFLYGKRKGTTLYLFVPHIALAIFAARVYFAVHHIGVWYLLFGFWIIISYEKPDVEERSNKQERGIFRQFSGLAIGVVLLFSSYQGISSCVLDIVYPYYPSKEVARFLEENNLLDYKIMIGWGKKYEESETISLSERKLLEIYPEETPADSINAYLERNIFYNYREGSETAFIPHTSLSKVEVDAIIEGWRNQGYPDILVGGVDLELVFGNEEIEEEYVIVLKADERMIWKGYAPITGRCYVQMRKELAEKLGIEIIVPSVFEKLQ